MIPSSVTGQVEEHTTLPFLEALQIGRQRGVESGTNLREVDQDNGKHHLSDTSIFVPRWVAIVYGDNSGRRLLPLPSNYLAGAQHFRQGL